MTQTRKVTLDDLYAAWVTLIAAVTNRPVWRKTGIQVAPKGPYATIYLKEGPSPTQDVVVTTQEVGGLTQYPVGLTRLECRAEFFRNAVTATAYEAAVRFRQSLQLENRFLDVWQLCGLVGEIRLIDVSAMFRADVEGRAEVLFNVYADLGALPLAGSLDNIIIDIDHQPISVYRDTTDDKVADLTINSP